MDFLFLPGTLVWLAAIVVLLIIEANTADMVTIWFAVGAAAALLASQLHAGMLTQAVVFVLVSLAALAASRPLVRRIKQRPPVPTNADRNLGRKATVLAPIAPGKPGRVRLDGIDWTARTAGEHSFAAGEVCCVAAMESTVLVVEPVPAAV